MSYDLNFWKYQPGVYLDHQTVYEACSAGRQVPGLAPLPIESILAQVTKTFSDWTRLGDVDYEKAGAGAFQIFTTPQFVRFDCYGMDGDHMNKLIDVMITYDCPLYDPQVSTRFDGQ